MLKFLKELLLTKEKSIATKIINCNNTQEIIVKAKIISYDYVQEKFVVMLENGMKYFVPWEDITMYQKNYYSNNSLLNLLDTDIKLLYRKNNNSYVLSRAEYMKQRIQKFSKDDIVTVTVLSASNDALYVEFDEGLSGKIYTNQLTSSQVKSNLDLYSIGDKIECKITKIKDDGYFEFSRIAMYKGLDLNIRHGEILKCKITKMLDDSSGFFVEVISNPLYSGIFDITYKNKDNYQVGEIVDLKVSRIGKKRQLHLSTVSD